MKIKRRTLTVRVTQKDIEQGRENYKNIASLNKCFACLCPMAIAIGRALPGASVEVFNYAVVINSRSIAVPPKVLQWVGAFDNQQHVEPISFKLSICP